MLRRHTHTLANTSKQVKVKEVDSYSAFIVAPHTQGAQVRITQSVLNAAARLIYRRRKFDHVSPLLKELHWLRVPERITFRLAVLVKATAGVFCVVPICGLAAFPIR